MLEEFQQKCYQRNRTKTSVNRDQDNCCIALNGRKENPTNRGKMKIKENKENRKKQDKTHSTFVKKNKKIDR